MEKNAIKKYAVWARKELIDRVCQKAHQYGITDKDIVPATAASVNGVVLSSDEMKQRKALIEKIGKDGYQQVMEEVAYTWFNRFIALRFMEVNGYLPSRVRVFTDENNQFEPQIITEAIDLEMDGLDMEKVYAYKDANDKEGLFKYLIIVQCNALSPIMPVMFQRIADYTELLFPDNLLRKGSVIQQMIELIPEEDWTDQVQIIGWLYQYYNSVPKDMVFANLKKNIKIRKEDIPAATQLFTPDWIVRYMVENSLGRIFVDRRKNEGIFADGRGLEEMTWQEAENKRIANEKYIAGQMGWKYYLPEAEQTQEVREQLDKIQLEHAKWTVQDLKVMDPCMGSGHILVYAFDVLMQIYEYYGYNARDAVASIVQNNLYGLDIDDRAAQLAYFAVMMKARQYDRRFLSRKNADGYPDVPQPHVYAIQESNGIDPNAIEDFVGGDPTLKKAMDSILKEMYDAKEYGSILSITSVDFDALYTRFDQVYDEFTLSRETILTDLLPLVRVAEALSQKYDVVVTNPPYMGAGGMGAKLADFVKKNYPDSKSDLSTCFMEKCTQLCNEYGYYAMINIPVWMFLSSFEKLRQKMLTHNTISSMVHPGRGIFGSDFGTTAFVISKKHIDQYYGTYRRLFDKQGEVESIDEREQAFLSGKGAYTAQQENFSKIPGSPVAYWVSEAFLHAFSDNKSVGELAVPKQGSTLGDNSTFLRFWFEIGDRKCKWYNCMKGGEYRRWYGNIWHVLDWENNGEHVKSTGRATIRSENLLFKEGITWSNITSGKSSFRYMPSNFFFESTGSVCFVSKDLILYLLAFLNTPISEKINQVINPTIHLQSGDIAKLPLRIAKEVKSNVEIIVKDNIHLSKTDWDSFETSWDFTRHPLVEYRHSLSQVQIGPDWAHQSYYIKAAYEAWEYQCQLRFDHLKANEEELNRIFIDIYGLQDELTPDVEDKDVTVRKADLQRDIRSFISYAVGCMLGRYSLDCEGLAYAGGEWDASKYTTFPADQDNIIPICDDEYFEDDIVGRFIKFVETVYGQETLQENLKFIADALGGKGSPKEVIRNYFLNDFYADHLKTYQKRPIYWLFDSGKKNGFKALIYMHRYQPDTIARMRTDYVHEQQSRYRTAIADIEQRIASSSTSERVKLNKKLKTLQDQAAESQTYEEKIHHLADQYISIDLDDGVKKNYAIFGDVLAKIK